MTRNSLRLPLILGASVMAMAMAAPVAADSIRVGVTPGPHAEIMDQVATLTAEQGLEIEVMEFSDYVVPNEALASGDLDANSFQHLPYLENQIADRGYDLIAVADTVIFPMGFYSNRFDSIDELPDGSTIAIQNDPTNGGRSLLLLDEAGLISLVDDAGVAPSLIDIVDNPHDFDFIELDAAQLPRSLDDVDLAAVNTNYAIEAGLDPETDALLREASDSPYVNVIAVRTEDEDADWLQTLIEAYHSDEIRTFVDERFEGSLVTSW